MVMSLVSGPQRPPLSTVYLAFLEYVSGCLLGCSAFASLVLYSWHPSAIEEGFEAGKNCERFMPPNQRLPPVLIGTGALASSRLSPQSTQPFGFSYMKDRDLNHELEAAYYW